VAKNSKHLFAFDLDGTLVHEFDGVRSIPPELLQSLHLLESKHHVTIATGRRYRSAIPAIELLPKMPFVICHNGLVILDGAGKIVYRNQLPWPVAEEIALRIREEAEWPIFIFDGEGDVPDFAFSERALVGSHGVRSVQSFSKNRTLVFDDLTELSSEFHPHLLEVACVGKPADLERLQIKLETKLPPGIRSVLVRNCGMKGMGVLEVFSKSFSKWSGVEWVKSRLGAMITIVAGDDENDVEMLKAADFSLVMDHAQAHVLDSGKIKIKGSIGLNQYLLENWLK